MKKLLILVILLIIYQFSFANNGNWELQYTSAVEQLQILRASAGMIYGVGYKYFVKSVNGADFQNIMVADCDSLHLKTVWMISSSIGYCGGFIGNHIMQPVLYKTDDGGQNWTKFEQIEQQSVQCLVQNIQFVSEQEGYLVFYPLFGFDGFRIYRTIDGGQNWSLVYELTRGFPGASDFSSSLMVIGTGFPHGALVSTNGLNWQFYEMSDFYPTAVIVSNKRLISLTFSGFIYSDDLGINWLNSDQSQVAGGVSSGCLTSHYLSGQNNNIYAIMGLMNNNYQIFPGIVRSLNNGVSWQWIVQPNHMPDQSGQLYGICYWGEYIYIAHNLCIYRMYVGPPVDNDDPVVPFDPKLNLTCYPNPFKGSTKIKFNQIDDGPTTMSIYNIKGQLIRTLMEGELLPVGEHEVRWDGKTASGQQAVAGVYLCKLRSKEHSSTRKVILVR